MTLSVSRLLDIGLNVDTSGLESFLSQIRDRLDGLQDRVADLENDGGMTEDKVQDIVDASLADKADEDHYHDQYADVDHSHDDMLTTDNAYDAISDQVYDMVKDVVREDLDEKDFADKGTVEELDSRVTEVEQTAEAIQQRLTQLEDGDSDPDKAYAALIAKLSERIDSLEADRSEHLRLIQDLQESSSGATRFFKLAVQMLDIVRESVGR